MPVIASIYIRNHIINEDVIQLDSDEDDSDAGDPLEISKGNEAATSCTEF